MPSQPRMMFSGADLLEEAQIIDHYVPPTQSELLRTLQESINRIRSEIITGQEEMAVPQLTVRSEMETIVTVPNGRPFANYNSVPLTLGVKSKSKKEAARQEKLEAAVKDLHVLIGEHYEYTHKKKECAILAKIFELLNEAPKENKDEIPF